VISGLLWRGTPHQLLQAIRQRSEVRVFSSQALLEELADVLTRPAATKHLSVIGKTAREVLADFVEAVELVEPTNVPRVVTTAPDDDHVIAAAVAAQGELVVSGDRDLLALSAYQEITIVSSAEALARLIAA
jgi:putative PIN family toxin of toxin-antitoxin system